ncbi:MAG: biosynthetic arginine decarboxylase [Deltaproteobacteria bacterium]|nr:biosynthetic arginine decarboxylase [Deltaproteobacteria bacterium]MBI4374327.1 biosynthetic arginine decarboxylase [Deltaproteobacteria bacterium]
MSQSTLKELPSREVHEAVQPLKIPSREKEWTRDDAIRLYNIDSWGSGHFSINDQGEVVCIPVPLEEARLSIMDVVREAKKRGLNFPLQIRFQDLLRHRVRAINLAFQGAIADQDYKGVFRGVFPIKVNQLREVVEEILDVGREFHHGIEVGSKPELVAALAINDVPESLIVCNGYKDNHFIRLALMGQKIGRSVILVVEKADEIERIIKIARELETEPVLGVRLRLMSKSSGKWATSSGETAKFGLSDSEALDAWETLAENKLEHCLKMIHFHIGSQVPDIMHIKQATREAARYYSKFVQLGAKLEYLDVGGGLGVDYDGTGTTNSSSTNYTLDEYASTVVYNVKDICDQEKVTHPVIVSESGRATVAHHTVLVVEAFGNVEKSQRSKFMDIPELEKEHKIIRDIIALKKQLSYKKKLIEVYHALQQLREEAFRLFDVGMLDLVTKAKADYLYWQIAEQIVGRFMNNGRIPKEIAGLNEKLSDQYICNFSIFQSVMDNWAIGQVFPIIPIHRLNEEPKHRAKLVDITCDSEGVIDDFIDLQDSKKFLPVHKIKREPYYLGIFLIGAYQDIMGDQHNLFGRTNEVHVFFDPEEEGGFYLEEVIPGSTIDQVLHNTQYDTNDLARNFKKLVDDAIKDNRLRPSVGMSWIDEYRKVLADYTYLSDGQF